MKRLITRLFLIALPLVYFMSSCEPVDEPTPTHDLMQGVWELTEAYDESDSLITDRVTNLFPTFLHLDDNNSVNSTAGPLFMNIVYGQSDFVTFMGKLDDAFKYVDMKLTEGEYFMIKNEVVERFTVEIKMKFITMESLTTILEMIGINPPGLMEAVIYHKFMDVEVLVNDDNPDVMTWTFDDTTVPAYNIKDQYGNYVSWSGVSVGKFSKVQVVWAKRVKSLTDLVQEAAGN